MLDQRGLRSDALHTILGDTQIAPEATIVLLIVLTLPIAWLISELTEYRSLRVGLGIAAITSMLGVSFLVGSLSRLNYNSSYGGASKDLIETTVSQIENGEIDRVMSVLRQLNLDYKPTYENRAHYDELVRDAVEQMKGRADLDGTRWDASPFTRETWNGHWENDTGFWLVIKRNGELQITRSGDTTSQIDKLNISEDFKSLAFIEGNGCSLVDARDGR